MFDYYCLYDLKVTLNITPHFKVSLLINCIFSGQYILVTVFL